MPSGPDPAPELESVAWKAIQESVRSFLQAWRRGELPAIESCLSVEASARRHLLLELIHEELELKVEAGEAVGVAHYLERFRELAGDSGS